MTSVIRHLASVHWPLLAAAATLQVAKLLVRSRAWHGLLRAAFPETQPRWPAVAGAVLAAAGVNAAAPARLGDVVKLAVARRELGARCCLPTVGATMLVEATLDVVLGSALICAVVASGRLVAPPALAEAGADALHGVLTRPWLAAAAACGVAVAASAARLVARSRLAVLRTIAADLRRGLAALRDPGRYARDVASWQLAAWGLRVGCVLCVLRAFGIEATPTVALLVVAAQILSGIVPVAGGAGVQQALVVVALHGRASAGEAVAFSLGLQALVAATNVAMAATVAAVALPRLGVGGIRALVARRVAAEAT